MRAGYLVHAARGQNVEEWNKWDKPKARPSIPPYERPEALIYQATRTSGTLLLQHQGNALCERGRVDA